MFTFMALALGTSFARASTPELCNAALDPEPPRLEIVLEISDFDDLDRFMRTLPAVPARSNPITNFFKRGLAPDVQRHALEMLNHYKEYGWIEDHPLGHTVQDHQGRQASERYLSRRFRAKGTLRRLLAPGSWRETFASSDLDYAQTLSWEKKIEPGQVTSLRFKFTITIVGDLDLLEPGDRARLEDARTNPRGYILGPANQRIAPPSGR